MSLYTFTSSYNCPVVAICVAIDHFKFVRDWPVSCRIALRSGFRDLSTINFEVARETA